MRPSAWAPGRVVLRVSVFMAEITLPSVSSEGGLTRYLAEIRTFPMLERDEEFMMPTST